MSDPNRDKHRQVLKLAEYKGYGVLLRFSVRESVNPNINLRRRADGA